MRKLIRKISEILFMVTALFAFASCSTMAPKETAEQQQMAEQSRFEQLQNQMFADVKPDNHFDEIREYVFEKYSDMPEDVETLVKNTNPKVVNNKSDLEYCFFWTLSDGSILEVVTTPPPSCTPLAVKHSKYTSYE